MDAVINHMCGVGSGSGYGSAGSWYNSQQMQFPGVPFGPADFGCCHCPQCSTFNCGILNYSDLLQVRNSMRCVYEVKYRDSTSIAPQASYCCYFGAVRHRQSRHTTKAAARARTPGLLPAVKQPYAAPICHLMVSTSYLDYYPFTDPGGMEG